MQNSSQTFIANKWRCGNHEVANVRLIMTAALYKEIRSNTYQHVRRLWHQIWILVEHLTPKIKHLPNITNKWYYSSTEFLLGHYAEWVCDPEQSDSFPLE